MTLSNLTGFTWSMAAINLSRGECHHHCNHHKCKYDDNYNNYYTCQDHHVCHGQRVQYMIIQDNPYHLITIIMIIGIIVIFGIITIILVIRMKEVRIAACRTRLARNWTKPCNFPQYYAEDTTHPTFLSIFNILITFYHFISDSR